MDFAFDQVRAAAEWKGTIQKLVWGMKYNQQRWLAPWLGSYLAAAAATAVRESGATVIVAIPLHPVRLREREYNQALELARPLGEWTGLPVLEGVVERYQLTPTQTRLDRRARLRNVESAFRTAAAGGLAGEHIVLVDDVVTTGATVHGCARALKRGGARRVDVWCLARGR